MEVGVRREFVCKIGLHMGKVDKALHTSALRFP